jgi:hypothetical protein
MSSSTERLAEVNSGNDVDFEPAAKMPEIGSLRTERWALSQAAPLSRLRGQMTRQEQS